MSGINYSWKNSICNFLSLIFIIKYSNFFLKKKSIYSVNFSILTIRSNFPLNHIKIFKKFIKFFKDSSMVFLQILLNFNQHLNPWNFFSLKNWYFENFDRI
jgi:hypothetical protein